jgi:hypothetical protein
VSPTAASSVVSGRKQCRQLPLGLLPLAKRRIAIAAPFALPSPGHWSILVNIFVI